MTQILRNHINLTKTLRTLITDNKPKSGAFRRPGCQLQRAGPTSV